MLQETINKIKSIFNPNKIILFGSYAWGNPANDSDFDLLVIMESKEERHSKRVIEILSKCHPEIVSLDLIVRTPKEIKERLEIGDPFIKKIIEEGKVLYAKP